MGDILPRSRQCLVLIGAYCQWFRTARDGLCSSADISSNSGVLITTSKSAITAENLFLVPTTFASGRAMPCTKACCAAARVQPSFWQHVCHGFTRCTRSCDRCLPAHSGMRKTMPVSASRHSRRRSAALHTEAACRFVFDELGRHASKSSSSPMALNRRAVQLNTA